MFKSSSSLALVFAAVVLMALAHPAFAQQVYPSRPIHFIVPFPPGGSTDPMARMAAHKLAERWGQPVNVENRPGGNTIIGNDAVAKAPADGYTILLVSSPFVIMPSLVPHLPYDPIKDFDGVASIAKSRYVLVLHPSIATNDLHEFIAFAKSKPRQLNYASAGLGASIPGELFNIVAGTKIEHVPYKGSGALIPDLISGQVQLSFQVPISVISYVKSKKLKAIALTGETRIAPLPQVPTFAEAGLPGYDITGWFGIVAPAGTPRDVIEKLSGEMAMILALPDIRGYLTNQGMDPFILSPDQVSARLRTEIARYAKVIKTANIKPEQ